MYSDLHRPFLRETCQYPYFFSRRNCNFIEAVLVPEVVRAVLVCNNDNGKLGVGFNGIYAERSVGEMLLDIGS